MTSLSIIIPTLNEAAGIEGLLRSLQPLRMKGGELILVDGGSRDNTVTLAEPLVDQVHESPPGRALQMNAGARRASGEVLWFLHADCLATPGHGEAIIASLRNTSAAWGRFDVTLSGSHPLFRVIGFLMNQRSRLTGIATGDQGIFVRRSLFEALGGFAEIPLMEDLQLSSRLRRHGPPLCLRQRLVTSSRRWEEAGIVRTILLMWRLRLAYFLGADPYRLARRYT
ncbi:MAG: TIGR04283 family arsenosugar biosynthesis glycosyltransferase [Sedimenticola sp.]|nr:TIGR04283 family arsenosugar biosynthesis glycosyltransferase [Sedimenticola sp.]